MRIEHKVVLGTLGHSSTNFASSENQIFIHAETNLHIGTASEYRYSPAAGQIVPSCELDAIFLPLGLKATLVTQSLCPSEHAPTLVHVRVFPTRIVLPHDPAATYEPLGLNETNSVASPCASVDIVEKHIFRQAVQNPQCSILPKRNHQVFTTNSNAIYAVVWRQLL